MATGFCLQLVNPCRQSLDQVDEGGDQRVESGVLGSLVLRQDLGDEAVELIGHRLRVLHHRARRVVDLRALRAKSCQQEEAGT